MKFLRMLFGPPSSEKAVKIIVGQITISAFRVFRNKKIRQILNFNKLEQVEQDRIFNELVVTGFTLINLMVETVSSLTEGERREFFKKVRDYLPTYYLEYLKELGIDEKYVALWRKLIDLRCDEYYKDRLEYRKYLPEIGEGNPWIPVATTGCLYHIRRGKPLPDDPLFNHLLVWTRTLAVKAEKTLLREIKKI